MRILATHNQGHTLPALLGVLALLGSLGLGVWGAFALQRWFRLVAVLAALSLTGVSYGFVKDESDTWWHRRCDPRPHRCADGPPLVPFINGPTE